jgi:hypothetical protein
MPFTVSCAACDSRFLLGDDLFRRKVSGKVVTVKCRNCNAEISVDATEPETLPSHEAPRRAHPAPPRPKSATGTPLPFGTATATGTPLPRPTATGTPLPPPRPTATGAPLPGGKLPATVTPLPAGALLSIWDAAEKSVEGPRKGPPPRPHAATLVHATEPEFIEDVEEAPPSSSDAPTLTTLKHEAKPPRKGAPRKAPDDFLVNLSTGTGGILGAPTIDVMGLASPPPPEVEELLEVEATELTPRPGTAPLFDMSAVLPVANESAKASGSSLSPSHVDLSIDVDMGEAPTESGKVRERKYVVAPKTREEPPPPKARRAGAAVWFVLVAAAAGVLLVVGLRSHHAAPETQPAEHPQTIAEVPTTSEVAPSAEPAPAAPSAVATEAAPEPIAANSAAASKPSSAQTANNAAPTSAKSPEAAKPAEAEKPVSAAPALEKPVEAEKPEAPAAPIAPRPEPADPGTEFDRSAAVAALKSAAAEAAACRKDGDPSGTATLTITFAPSGRVTSANIQGPPFAGTPTGGCIANAMRRAHVPAFSGDRVTVNKTIVIQ